MNNEVLILRFKKWLEKEWENGFEEFRTREERQSINEFDRLKLNLNKCLPILINP